MSLYTMNITDINEGNIPAYKGAPKIHQKESNIIQSQLHTIVLEISNYFKELVPKLSYTRRLKKWTPFRTAIFPELYNLRI
jgi:hypothetical protein